MRAAIHRGQPLFALPLAGAGAAASGGDDNRNQAERPSIC